MPDEKKVYLVDVQSNLDEYMREVMRTREEVERLTIEQIKLKGNVKSTDEELEKANSELRVAQKEYNNARKNLDTFTTAGKAAKGSYQELYNLWKLSSVQLKLLEGTLKRNADGTYILTDAYIKARRENLNYKIALDAFGKGIKDNRLNVGNYTESIQAALSGMSMMPGVAGRAGMAIEHFGSIFKRLAGTGGIGAILIAITAALSALAAPLIAFFKNSEKGAELLERKVSGFSAAFDVLRGKLIEVGDTWTTKFEEMGRVIGEEGPKNKLWQALIMPLQLFAAFIKLTLPGLVKLVDEMNKESIVAEDLTGALQDLKEAEIALIPERANASLELRKAREAMFDVNKTTEERIAILEAALKTEDKVAAKELANAEENLRIVQLNFDRMDRARQNDDAEKQKLAEAQARRDQVEAESVGRKLRTERALLSQRQTFAEETYKLIAAEEKLYQIEGGAVIESLKNAKEMSKTFLDQMLLDENINYDERERMRDEFDTLMRSYDEKIYNEQIFQAGEKKRIALAEVDSKIMQDADISRLEREAIEKQYHADVEKIINDSAAGKIAADYNVEKRRIDAKRAREKAGIDAERIDNENRIQNRYQFLNEEENILNREMTLEFNSAEFKAKSREEQAKIEANYTKVFIALGRARMDFSVQELSALGQAFGDLASQFKKHTAAYKVLSIAQATIAVITAATQAMNNWENFTVIQKITSAATILAYGFALINQLKAVSTSGSPSEPKTIAGSFPASRATAPTVGATILTQPQLSPAQAATIPNANALSVEQLISAIKELPSPVVTVEDINIRAAEKNQVEVRARI